MQRTIRSAKLPETRVSNRFVCPIRFIITSCNTISYSNMPTAMLQELAACTTSILRIVGPPDSRASRLHSSGRLPNFPTACLRQLVPAAILATLTQPQSSTISSMLDSTLASMRSSLWGQFKQVVAELYSPSRWGMDDFEVESQIIKQFETMFDSCLGKIRVALQRLLSPIPLSSTVLRGGFGDVSRTMWM